MSSGSRIGMPITLTFCSDVMRASTKATFLPCDCSLTTSSTEIWRAVVCVGKLS
jgi:hypothetical protein